MLLSCLLPLASGLVAAPAPVNLLFLGNSHTQFNDLPGMVERLMESDGAGRQVNTKFVFGSYLNDLDVPQTHALIRSQKWDAVILQAWKLSMSHSRVYSQQGGINLARTAKETGAKLFLFAEWPRRGVANETAYTLQVVAPIAKQVGGRLVPVCTVWDRILATRNDLPVWQPDGNHALPLGTYIAATSFYYALTGKQRRNPRWSLPGYDSATLALIHAKAAAIIQPE